jgi:hypothetical protein
MEIKNKKINRKFLGDWILVSSLGLLSDNAYVDSSLIPVREYWRKLKEVLNSLVEFLDGGE